MENKEIKEVQGNNENEQGNDFVGFVANAEVYKGAEGFNINLKAITGIVAGVVAVVAIIFVAVMANRGEEPVLHNVNAGVEVQDPIPEPELPTPAVEVVGVADESEPDEPPTEPEEPTEPDEPIEADPEPVITEPEPPVTTTAPPAPVVTTTTPAPAPVVTTTTPIITTTPTPVITNPCFRQCAGQTWESCMNSQCVSAREAFNNPQVTTAPITTTTPPAQTARLFTATELEEIASEIFRLTNLERTANGVNTLSKGGATLQNVANIRVDEAGVIFVRDGNLGLHTRPNGDEWLELLNELSIPWNGRSHGENLGRYSSSSLATIFNNGVTGIAERRVSSWRNSPGHFATMINANWTHLSVGVTQLDDGTIIAVQIFFDSNAV